VAFQRKKSAAIGVKAPLLGFIDPALTSSIARVPAGARWIFIARAASRKPET
jgi:bifunctional non-homologous end joining protein LigD